MSAMKNINSIDLSRRSLFRGAALIIGGGALVGATLTAGVAGAKLPQKSVEYQDAPKGKARCDNCVQWQAPNACKAVAGVIKPSGWCTIYAPKS
jgi:hypothetical protein